MAKKFNVQEFFEVGGYGSNFNEISDPKSPGSELQLNIVAFARIYKKEFEEFYNSVSGSGASMSDIMEWFFMQERRKIETFPEKIAVVQTYVQICADKKVDAFGRTAQAVHGFEPNGENMGRTARRYGEAYSRDLKAFIKANGLNGDPDMDALMARFFISERPTPEFASRIGALSGDPDPIQPE